MAAGLLVGAALTTACSSGLPRSAAGAPVLEVVTATWPIAQMAADIGGAKASVEDVVPVGADPLTFQPDAHATSALRHAGLVLLAGHGLQPAVDVASHIASPTPVLRVADAAGSPDPYVWLDPALMPRAVQAIADAMAAADPAAAPVFRRNVAGLRSEIQSLDIDFSSTLSTCRATVLVTPDRAFATMSGHYGLTDLVASSSIDPSSVSRLRTRIEGSTGASGLIEPWVDDGGVRRVAAGTGLRLHPVDTLVGQPPTAPATGAQNTYVNRMEQILSVLSGALRCDSGNQ